VVNLDFTTRLVVLEMTDRLEIERQFDRSSVFKLGFLSRGDTTDFFRVE